MTIRSAGVFAMLLLSSVIAIGWGLAIVHGAHRIVLDYRLADMGARCLIHHCDLYNETAMTQFYLAHGGERSTASSSGEPTHYLVGFQVYPPTAELFFAPFALFSWPVSYIAWIALSLILLTIAAFLMWKAAHVYAPDLPFYLAWFLLLNSGGLLAGGNPAAAAVGLGVIGVWCILEDRRPIIGVICFAVSIAIKPHDAGLIWLYLLLLGVPFRKRALQSFVMTALFGTVGVLWVWTVSSHWVEEARSNLAALASNGSCNDPAGPAAISMINLQTVLALLRNEPRFYNGISFAIFAPLALVFLFVAMRIERSRKSVWLGLAVITVLSLLPLYHRPYDAKILLLTLPACAMLWKERGATAWLALVFTAGGIIATSELPLIFVQILTASPSPGFLGQVFHWLITRPAPLILLAESVFYLIVYVKHYLSVRQSSSSIRPAALIPSAG